MTRSSLTLAIASVSSTSVGGNFDVREMKVESLELAEADLSTHDVLVSDGEEMEPYQFDGLMAMGGFRQIAVDFPAPAILLATAQIKALANLRCADRYYDAPLRAPRSLDGLVASPPRALSSTR